MEALDEFRGYDPETIHLRDADMMRMAEDFVSAWRREHDWPSNEDFAYWFVSFGEAQQSAGTYVAEAWAQARLLDMASGGGLSSAAAAAAHRCVPAPGRSSEGLLSTLSRPPRHNVRAVDTQAEKAEVDRGNSRFVPVL